MIVNIKKRFAYAIIGLLVLAVGVFVVNAFGTSNPSVMGHSAGEIDWSEFIPQLNTESINLGGELRSSWPVDTNANTQCSGTYTYLSGDGACRDVRTDGDAYDTDTNTWRPAQTLSVSGQTLSISSGNSVSLPGGVSAGIIIYYCPIVGTCGGTCDGSLSTSATCSWGRWSDSYSCSPWSSYDCTAVGHLISL